jgi:23S rRNA (cytosine1962-C5)-methyltransferase
MDIVSVGPTLYLKAGHVQPVWAGHPWVYAQAVARIEGGAVGGEELSVVDPRGNFLGKGFYSPGSAIPIRILSRDPNQKFDAAFFEDRIRQADDLRKALKISSAETDGYRVVHAEGDGLPGLIVDRFRDSLSVQFATKGLKLREGLIYTALDRIFKPKAILDRTGEKYAKAEGFNPGEGVVRGTALEAYAFRERGFEYRIPTAIGHKTGYYFDQRDVRARVESIAAGKRVLDAYGYVGSFALAAARGGATEVISVDESLLAVEAGAECARMNKLDSRIRFVKEDARHVLSNANREFDLAIVDPPRLAPSRKARESALMHYTKLAALACRTVKPGGILVFCSCSSIIDLPSLTRALATGAQRAGVTARVLERLFQAADHPVSAAFGEGLYLKCLVAQLTPR